MRRDRLFGVMLLFMSCIAVCIWYAAIREDRHGFLKVSFLDVGQGDAIYIETPNGTQVLIDGGPDSTVVRRLGEVMPWYDRSIDLVIGTHPDADHIGGLINVFSRYKVGTVMQSSVLGTTETWKVFEKDMQMETPHHITAMRGQILYIGGGAYLEVLAPDRSVPNLETNTACVVTRLVYGKTSFMLPCDAPQAVEKYLVALDGDRLHSSVLKPGHHGSKTSSAPLFVGFVNPQYAVFSRGCDNRYGHPNQETINTLSKFDVPVLDTCKEGTVTFVSDGNVVAQR